MVLLDIANKVNGLDVGTKDLSEQADGWCTYNGDQISNYDINAGLTKTMVRAVVKYVADTCDDAELAAALHDIWDTPVTPELLPIGDEGELLQKSEDSGRPLHPAGLLPLAHGHGAGAPPRRSSAWPRSPSRANSTAPRSSTGCTATAAASSRSSSSAAPRPTAPRSWASRSPRRDGHKMPSDASNALWIGAVENMK